MQQLTGERINSSNGITIEELYDRYAPAVYGKILGAVKHKDVAEKILEKVFVTALTEKKINAVHLTPFTKLLNHTHRKTQSTLTAIKILQTFTCGH